MPPQAHDWTCSVCSITWVIQATGTAYTDLDPISARQQVGATMGYPSCVNETYGCMSTQCVKDTFNAFGLDVDSAYCTFDQAYAIARDTTGTINPQSMYHFMGIRGVDGSNLWLANSANGYMGIWETMTRSQFNNLGPVELVYLTGQ